MLPTAVSTTTTTTTTGGVCGGPIADMDLTTTTAAAAVHQPMDWLFKKERIYWLAQFWQQKAILAEKEISALKGHIPTSDNNEKMDSIESNNKSLDFSTNMKSLLSPNSQAQSLLSLSPNSTSILNSLPLLNGTTNTLNGTIPHNISNLLTSNLNLNLNGNFVATAASPSPPLSDNESVTSGVNNNNNNNHNHQNNNNNIVDETMNSLKCNKLGENKNDSKLELNKENQSNGENSFVLNENHNVDDDEDVIMLSNEEQLKDFKNSNESNDRLKSSDNQIDNDNIKTDELENSKRMDTSNGMETTNERSINSCSPQLSELKENNVSANDEIYKNTTETDKISNENKKENEESEISTDVLKNENSLRDLRNKNLSEELAFKDKEIRILSDEVTRLKILYEQQILHNQRLQDDLEQKLKIILRLESHLNNNDNTNNNNNNNENDNDKNTDSNKNDNNSTLSIPNISENNENCQLMSQASLGDADVIVKKEKSDVSSNGSPSPTRSIDNLKITSTQLLDNDKESFENHNNNYAFSSVRNQRDTYDDDHYNSEDDNSEINESRHLHNIKSAHYDTHSNPSTPTKYFTQNDGRRSNDPNILSPFAGKFDMKENAANSLQHMATAGPFGGSHMPNPFHAGLQFSFSTQSQDRSLFSRFNDDMHVSAGAGGSNSTSGRYNTDLLIPKGDPMEAKLQEMLRYGLDKFANHNLDTLYISRRVRELLSVHNIGQRIFAKYVLGLSQGTVSELLSKPKPWDKLTEKGRDSYRKMHAWACDESAILLLKTLIPKKDSNLSQFGYSDERLSEERFPSSTLPLSSSPILPKPSIHVSTSLGTQSFNNNYKPNQTKEDDARSNEDLKSPVHGTRSDTPLSNKDSRSIMNNSMKEQSPKLDYHEELLKMMSLNQREVAPVFPGFLFPQFYGKNENGSVPPQMPSIEMALETYHRELAKLQSKNGAAFPNFTELLALQQQQKNFAMNGSAQDLSINKEKSENSIKDNFLSANENQVKSPELKKDSDLNSSTNSESLRQEKPMNDNSSRSQTPSTEPNQITSSILKPNSEDFSNSFNPLQRMASITNSLITQPPLPPLHSQSPRPLKAVLPPITQQQFDLYNNLNTEEIVRNVKEALSQYSISQRLFGENVLGLSQGSVSDLLARPKPWHMLTQKGREPFIRMKMFLEDDSAVHKLVASQYKIAPEKLMRTGNYTGTPQIPTSLVTKIDEMQSSPMQKILNDLKFKQESQQQQIMQQLRAVNVLANLPTTQHQPTGMLLAPPGIMSHYSMQQPSNLVNPNNNNNGSTNNNNNNNDSNKNSNNNNNNNNNNNMEAEKKSPMPISSPQPTNIMRSGQNQHMSPTVYEMAALTQDLDTQIITTKVKEVLLSNNIGQKIFGEAVLGLSQGSVSELLSKPKPWHMLSIKGREPFIRMQLWLSDMNNVEKLQALKNEQREANKRRRSIGPAGSHDNSDCSNDTNDFYTTSPGPASVGSNGVPPNKKQRVLFSEEQKEALRLAFTLDPYPNVTTIEFLANELGLATRTITNWFHNHRMRLKQQMPHGQPSEPIPTRENQTGPPLDPVQFKILLNQRLMELQKDRMGLTGVPLIYPPYFGGNPNLAALIAGHGLFANGESDLQAFNAVLKHQLNGMDLSRSHSAFDNRSHHNEIGVKEENDYNDENDLKNDGSEISDTESINNKSESLENDDIMRTNMEDNPLTALLHANLLRASRRKPSAPQWLNPDWQPRSLFHNHENNAIVADEMQEIATDFSRKTTNDSDNNNESLQSSTDKTNPDISIKTEHNESDDEPNEQSTENAIEN